MHRRGLPWLIALPCVAAGSEAGHAVGSRLVASSAREIAEGVASGAHVGQPIAPLVLGFVGALVFACGVLCARPGRWGRRAHQVPTWLFLAIPPAAWPVQEAIKRLVRGNGFFEHGALDPSLMLGLAIQVPFAVTAYLLARLLLRLIRAVAGRTAVPQPRRRRATIGRIAPDAPKAARTPVAALRRSQRAPPAPVAA